MTNVRADIPAKYKWDMTNIYPTEQDFDADYQKAADMIAAFPAHAETMSQSAQGLLSMFTDFVAMMRVVESCSCTHTSLRMLTPPITTTWL